jgi:uncharacterized protein (TIGR00255 family)
MVCSMTGFGLARVARKEGTIEAEARSVNGRYLDVRCSLPREWSALEPDVRARAQAAVARGQVSVTVNVSASSRVQKVIVDTALAGRVIKELQAAAGKLGLAHEGALDVLLRIPGVVRVQDDEEGTTRLQSAALNVVAAALKRLVASRRREGRALAQDMRQRLHAVERLAGQIKLHAPALVANYRERVLARLAEITQLAPTEFDEIRVLHELGIFAERVDITEELTRIQAHVRELRVALAQPGPIGRRIDFVLQELHRETTTIGNKANSLAISPLVVSIKEELEKMREQAQNIE